MYYLEQTLPRNVVMWDAFFDSYLLDNAFWIFVDVNHVCVGKLDEAKFFFASLNCDDIV